MSKQTELVSMSKNKFHGDYETALIEQWKTCVEAANGISENRNTANNFFMSINTALLAFLVSPIENKGIVLCVIGIAICILWFFTIQNYKKLNSVKFHIVNDIEKMLPLAPFTYEWKQLKTKEKYIGLTKIEKYIPWAFVAMYFIIAICPLIRSLAHLTKQTVS